MSKAISTHPNSRRITIFRTGTFLSRAQNAQADEYFAMSRMSIGSYYESRDSVVIGSGLTFKEQELLLPLIVDTPPEDKDFRKKVREFYTELDTPVPYNIGVTLEIGLEKDNELAVSKDNMPLNVMDYLRYRHAYNHPKVAHSRDEAEGNQLIDYYIFDKDAVQSKSFKKSKEKDLAYQEFLKIKESTDQVDQMLSLLGVDIREYLSLKEADRKDVKEEKLRELAETSSRTFIEAYKGGELELRAAITNMVTTGVLKQIGKRYLDSETNDSLGNNLDEVVLYLKDEDNSQVLMVLKARLQEAMKTPVKAAVRRTRVS